MVFDIKDFGASYPFPTVDGNVVIMVNDAIINERGYCADFTTAALCNRVGDEFRFTQRVGGTTVDLYLHFDVLQQVQLLLH